MKDLILYQTALPTNRLPQKISFNKRDQYTLPGLDDVVVVVTAKYKYLYLKKLRLIYSCSANI